MLLVHLCLHTAIIILLPTPAHPQERDIFDDCNNTLANTRINDSGFGLTVATVFFWLLVLLLTQRLVISSSFRHAIMAPRMAKVTLMEVCHWHDGITVQCCHGLVLNLSPDLNLPKLDWGLVWSSGLRLNRTVGPV